MALMYQSPTYGTTPTDSIAISSNFITSVGQSFYSNGVNPISSISVWLQKSGAPTGNFNIQISALTGTPGSTAVPTGSPLVAGTSYSAAALTTSWVQYKLDINYVLPQGNYIFNLVYLGGNSTNFIRIGVSSQIALGYNAIPGQNLSYYTTLWQSDSDSDIMYRMEIADAPSSRDIIGSAYISAPVISMPVSGIVGGWGVSTIGGQAAGENLRPLSVTTDQTITGNARISKLVSRTIAGNARISKLVSRTIIGNARIAKLVSRTITGNARITASSNRTITGNARITATVDKTITGNARITATTDKTITGNATIVSSLVTTDRDITGNARITNTVDKTITGNASIRKTVDRTVSGNARIQKAVDRTIIGNARITAITTRTIIGNARITAVTSRTIAGNARIQYTTDRTITGNARISVTVSQNIVGNARIAKDVDRTIIGNARISTSTDRNIIGNARVVLTMDRDITGNAFIKKYTDPEHPEINTSTDDSLVNIIAERVDIQVLSEKPELSTTDYISGLEIVSDDKPSFR